VRVTLTNCLACTRELPGIDNLTPSARSGQAESEPGSKHRIDDSRDGLEEGSRNCNEFAYFSSPIIDSLRIP